MGGLVHSQRVLLALTQAGVSREDAYRLVQRHAMTVWDSDGALSLMELLKADPDVTAALSPPVLEARFDLDYRSEGRREGNEGVRTWRDRWGKYHKKNNKKRKN